MPLRINIPPLTRTLLVVLIALSFTAGAIRYKQRAGLDAGEGKGNPDTSTSIIIVPYLTIVPQLSLLYPWVFLTATFVEQNVFTLVATAATICYGGKYLERAWSFAEFAKFLLAVSLIPNVIAFAIYIIWYALTGSLVRSLTTICGGASLQAAFLVAFKQLVPEHTVTIAKGLFKVRVKHFPALFLLLTTTCGVVLGTDTTSVLAWLGFLTSWIYLRFFKTSPNFTTASTGEGASLRGDASETFAFAYFFPDPIHSPVASLSNGVYDILITLRICTPFSAGDVDAGNEQATVRGEGGLPSLLSSGGKGFGRTGGKREEAERRRALALKALDQRLHAAANKPQQGTLMGESVLGKTSSTPNSHETEGIDND
ncbi:MAG: hypothetical protein M1827_005043 [Pycnora praestabilis]|nr:MAG: hypothetical protein M1827_005043 [Pycnora praestabilis]